MARAGKKMQAMLAAYHKQRLASAAREQRDKPKAANEDGLTPTPEQMRDGSFDTPDSWKGRTSKNRAGKAYRKVPVIERLFADGKIKQTEYDMLSYYADQANLAERSPVKSNLDRTIGGMGNGPSSAITSALIETGRIERDLGQLRPIARAIAVDDMSLSQWCINQHGGRERYDKRGKFVAMVPIGEQRVMKLALLELRMASHRIIK